jgi:hypothetical protein
VNENQTRESGSDGLGWPNLVHIKHALDLLQLLYGTACRDRECCYCDGYIYPLREFSALESIAQVAWFDTICGERA